MVFFLLSIILLIPSWRNKERKQRQVNGLMTHQAYEHTMPPTFNQREK